MRRIYESDALERSDEEPHTPRERRKEYEPSSFRWINAASWSDRLVPHGVRARFVTVSISTPRREFDTGEQIPFVVTMKNRLPIPITIKTASVVPWRWSVDDQPEAARVSVRDPPDRRGHFRFDRGETKRFRKRWSGKFRIAEREWETASPGEHTLSASINVVGSGGRRLSDETTVEILPPNASA